VRPEVMFANLGATRGAVYSEAVLLALADKGVSREEAYEIVQRNALKAVEMEADFQQLLEEDSELSQYLERDEIASCFDLEVTLSRVKDIFTRVGLT